ncbi:MAG: phosphoribosyl-AMP cyclohydrolase [Pseudomonadota bacterium]
MEDAPKNDAPKNDTSAEASPQRLSTIATDPETFLASLKWDANGLIPAIAQDAAGGQVLMMAWMNAQSLLETIHTKRVTYWSRSRAALWRKGDTSGHVQDLVDLRVDCDRDCLLMLVNQTGAACHTHRRSCFYTALRDDTEVELMPPME